MLRIFMPIKIQRLRPGLNPQTWVPEASVLTTRPPKPSGPTVEWCCMPAHKNPKGTFGGIFILLDCYIYLLYQTLVGITPCTVNLAMSRASLAVGLSA